MTSPNLRILSRNVRLLQCPELMPFQGLLGGFVVFHAETDDGFPLGLREEGVKIVDIQLGLQERSHQPIQIGWVDFNDNQVAFGEWKALLHKQFAGAVRVIYNDSNYRAVGRVQDHQAKDMHAPRIQEPDEIVQPAESVGGENGELDHRIGPARF
jgi:hypothetical protein